MTDAHQSQWEDPADKFELILGATHIWVSLLSIQAARFIGPHLTRRNATLGALHALNIVSICGLLWAAHLAERTFRPAPPSLITVTPARSVAAPAAALVEEPAASSLALVSSRRPARRSETLCLALNIYHEARGESLRGQVMVGHVTINRTKARYRGAKSICDTVYSPWQFSWTVENLPQPSGKRLAPYMQLASGILERRYVDRTHGAMHYYNPAKVDAWWKDAYVEVAVVGGHRFMR